MNCSQADLATAWPPSRGQMHSSVPTRTLRGFEVFNINNFLHFVAQVFCIQSEYLINFSFPISL